MYHKIYNVYLKNPFVTANYLEGWPSIQTNDIVPKVVNYKYITQVDLALLGLENTLYNER